MYGTLSISLKFNASNSIMQKFTKIPIANSAEIILYCVGEIKNLMKIIESIIKIPIQTV